MGGKDDETQLAAAAMANSISISISISTPKLLGIPPPKSRGGMQTPPLLPPVSIPFRWEEAPGKARPTAAATPKSKTVRCLELPPRLQMHEASPTTVLDEGRALSLACTFSFRKAGIISTSNLGSGSFRDDTIDFSSHSLRDFFTTEDITNTNTNTHHNNSNTRRCVKRRRSFFTFSTINSSNYFLGDIYASLKQAVPWRRQVRS